MAVRLMPPRFTVAHTDDELHVTIHPHHTAEMKFTSIFVLSLAVVVSGVLISNRIHFSIYPQLADGLYIAILVVLGLSVIVSVWCSYETLEISNTVMRLRSTIFGIGYRSSYSADMVSGLQVLPTTTQSFGNHQVPKVMRPAMALQFGSMTIFFARGIDEAEANMIREIIIQQFPQYGPQAIEPQVDQVRRYETVARQPVTIRHTVEHLDDKLRLILPIHPATEP